MQVVGNVMILMVYLGSASLRKPPNYFIINLALVDLMVAGVADPMCIIGEMYFLPGLGLRVSVVHIYLVLQKDYEMFVNY